MSAYFGQGTGPIMLDDVNCIGRESTIFACSHRNYGEHDCKHYEDVGVICYGESSQGKLWCVSNKLIQTFIHSETCWRQIL